MVYERVLFNFKQINYSTIPYYTKQQLHTYTHTTKCAQFGALPVLRESGIILGSRVIKFTGLYMDDVKIY